MELPKRKKNRLEEYDYNTPGAYYITVCTRNRRNILCNVVGACSARPRIELLKYGIIVDNAIKNIPVKYEGVFVDKYVIMPDHVHLMINIKNGRALHAPTVSKIIEKMKEYVTKQSGVSIWQKGFYDHVIRNQNDYNEIWEYIDNNPQKWVATKK